MAKETKNAFAIIETGGKQYQVAVGDMLNVELLDAAISEGDVVTFDSVVLTNDGDTTKVGTPYVEGAKVTGKYLGEAKGPKISIIRYKAKSNRDRKIGHRQKYARVEITAI